MSRREPEIDEGAYLRALIEVCRTPPAGALGSLRHESAELREGPGGMRHLSLRWSFEPRSDDPRARNAVGRIEGESSRVLDPHPMNDFYEPEPLAAALWEQAGLEAADLMRAAYDVAPGPVTDEHRARALALIPSREEWWQQLLDELSPRGRVLEQDEAHVDFVAHDGLRRTLAFGPDEWFVHLRDSVVRELAAGTNLERREAMTFEGWWDDLFETLGSSNAPVLILGEHGLEPHPDHPEPPMLPPDFDTRGGRWVAYRPLDGAD